MTSRLRLIIVALLLPAVGIANQNSLTSSVKILESSQQQLVIEYRPVFGATIDKQIDGEDFQVLSVENGIDNGLHPTPGSPSTPIISFPIRLRGEEGNYVEVLAADYEDIANVKVTPVPSLSPSNDVIGTSMSDYIDRNAYTHREFLPNTVAALVSVGKVQSAVFGNLVISPYQYNPGGKVLRKYSRIVVRVQLGSQVDQLRRTVANELVADFAINDDAFRSLDQQSVFDIQKTSSQSVLVNSVLSAGSWFRFPVTENGMYRLTGRSLLDAGVPMETDPGTIRIYGNGGIELTPAVEPTYVHDLSENSVVVNDAGTIGQLDADDAIIFYARGARGWRYNPTQRTFSHTINRYTETTYYWVAIGLGSSKRMTEYPSPNIAEPVRPSTVLGMIARDDDRFNLLNSGLEWVGQSFNPGAQQSYVHSLPGIDPNYPITYRIQVGSHATASSTFNVEEHGAPLPGGAISIQGTVTDGPVAYAYNQLPMNRVERTTPVTFTDGQSRLRFTYSGNGTGYLDWYEIFYHRRLEAQGDVLSFFTQDTAASVAEYQVTGFGAGSVAVYDVSRLDSAVQVTGMQIPAGGGGVTFQLDLSLGKVREIYVVGQNGYRSPSPLERIQNQNLHGDTTQAEYIIVAPPEFLATANRLKQHRERPGADFIRTMVVNVNDIYNEFGAGVSTPVAIRNYLRYRMENAPVPPQYVLLFGDGDYDYKRIISRTPNWIPPWETEESFTPIYTYATDDYFGIFNTTYRVSFGLGRLTAQSVQEANSMVDKIIEYETTPVRDPWKFRVTYVADDGPAGDRSDGNLHMAHAEQVARLVPSLFEQRKVYIYEYPTAYTPGGRRKPTANTTIRDVINQGTVLLNFSGHGNPRLWAHEQVFVRESDFSFLQNKNRYFFLVAATCNFSQFDGINDQSGGELLLSMRDAGAIGALSATRAVFAHQNLALNAAFFRRLFVTDVDGRLVPQRLGRAVFRIKQELITSLEQAHNHLKYFLLGDPAMVLQFPRMYASVDSINHQPTSQMTELRALSRASIAATVRDTVTGLPMDFAGQSQLVVHDADRNVIFTDVDDTPPLTYSYVTSGNVLFRGEQTVTQGSIGSSFIVPKDISYDSGRGRLAMYFWNSSTDGAAFTSNFTVGGVDSAAPVDIQGPTMKLSLDNRDDFRPGDAVSESPLLLVDLVDSSGINTSTAGIGHRLEAWLDGQSESIDLSNYYRSKPNTYQEGTVEYRLGSMTPGSHHLKVRAWDTYNNSSTGETVFSVGTDAGLQLESVLNFPNPFSSSTLFTFHHNQITPIDAEVKIYTVAGRLIHTLRQSGITAQSVRIPWDGRDRDGDEVANGIYLYKVVARTTDGRFSSEALGKLSVLK